MKTLELFDTGQIEPIICDVDEDARLVDLAEVDNTDILVLVNDAEGQAELIELDLTMTVGEVARGNAIVSLLRNPRSKVTVHVTYVDQTVPIHVHAATRLRRVRKLAIETLRLDAALAADTVLRMEGSEDDLPLKRPVGAYLDKGQHEISLDLVHKVRAQG